MVSRDNLNLMASKLNIGSLIKLGRGEKLEGNSILGNTFEALIGAVFLDSDYSTTQIILDNLFDGDFISIDEVDELKDPKSQLQEIIQKNYQSLPKYFVKEIANSSIKAKFEATCLVKEANLKSKGEGKTRKRSELEAAATMLQLLKSNES